MDGPKFGRAGARKQAARIGGWRPKNWKSGDQSRCRERPEFGNDPELEQCGPKIGKARQPAASGGSRRLENQYLSIISIVLKTACPSTPRSAAPGCLFCRRPLTRRRPAAFRDRPPLPVAPPVAPSRRPLGSSSPPTPTRRPTGCPVGRFFPSASRELLPADADPPPPGATGFDWLPRRSPPPLPVAPPAAPSRRTLGSSSPPTPTRRLPGPPVSTGCCAGLFFPPAIPIDPPVSPFAGPPRRTGGVCLPFGRNGGRKCRSRLEYCAEFPSFVTPKHQYHEKPPPRTLCVCGLLQCSAGRMLRA